MTQPNITERQQQWRDHVLAAASYDGTIITAVFNIRNSPSATGGCTGADFDRLLDESGLKQ